MKARFILLSLLALCVFSGCRKQAVPEGEDMHPFTEEELKKKQLETAFTLFFEKLKPETIEDPKQEIINNSHISFPYLGVVHYEYIKDGVTLITIDARTASFTVDFLGGVHLEGTKPLQDEVLVFYEDQELAKMGLILYNDVLMPVFRFDDGTSYAFTNILLVDSLIDYLLENVFSTE